MGQIFERNLRKCLWRVQLPSISLGKGLLKKKNVLFLFLFEENYWTLEYSRTIPFCFALIMWNCLQSLKTTLLVPPAT